MSNEKLFEDSITVDSVSVMDLNSGTLSIGSGFSEVSQERKNTARQTNIPNKMMLILYVFFIFEPVFLKTQL